MVVPHAERSVVHCRARHGWRCGAEDISVRPRGRCGMKRLRPVDGEWIDRTSPLEFTFEGRRLTGFAGDTISSALAANGVTVVGRSFKYRRPRGLFSVANEHGNAMFQGEQDGRSVPNVRGDVTPLLAGMKVTAVNTSGG